MGGRQESPGNEHGKADFAGVAPLHSLSIKQYETPLHDKIVYGEATHTVLLILGKDH